MLPGQGNCCSSMTKSPAFSPDSNSVCRRLGCNGVWPQNATPLERCPGKQQHFHSFFPCICMRATGPWCLSGTFDWETVVSPHQITHQRLHNTPTPYTLRCPRKGKPPAYMPAHLTGLGLPKQACIRSTHTQHTHTHSCPVHSPPSKRGAMAFNYMHYSPQRL